MKILRAPTEITLWAKNISEACATSDVCPIQCQTVPHFILLAASPRCRVIILWPYPITPTFWTHSFSPLFSVSAMHLKICFLGLLDRLQRTHGQMPLFQHESLVSGCIHLRYPNPNFLLRITVIFSPLTGTRSQSSLKPGLSGKHLQSWVDLCRFRYYK